MKVRFVKTRWREMQVLFLKVLSRCLIYLVIFLRVINYFAGNDLQKALKCIYRMNHSARRRSSLLAKYLRNHTSSARASDPGCANVLLCQKQ